MQLEFDDIARYGGLYGDGSGAPLAPLQVYTYTCTGGAKVESRRFGEGDIIYALCILTTFPRGGEIEARGVKCPLPLPPP